MCCALPNLHARFVRARFVWVGDKKQLHGCFFGGPLDVHRVVFPWGLLPGFSLGSVAGTGNGISFHLGVFSKKTCEMDWETLLAIPASHLGHRGLILVIVSLGWKGCGSASKHSCVWFNNS